MEMIVNRPPAETFGWLHAGGTPVEITEPRQEFEYLLAGGENRTIVLDDTAAFAGIRAELGEGACLNLVQIRHAGKIKKTVSDIHVRCGKNAQFHWYRLIFGGRESYDNCSAELLGDGSSFTADIGFRLDEEKSCDINCEAIHHGKHTDSRIFSSGVLSGRSSKLLRGTIDFRRGCSGSEGSESEDVLLLDKAVRSRSVPVILCSEEDVAGSHGATAGSPDERLLYYMEARGLSPEDALKMLSRAKLEAVINRLPDPGLIKMVRRKYL